MVFLVAIARPAVRWPCRAVYRTLAWHAVAAPPGQIEPFGQFERHMEDRSSLTGVKPVPRSPYVGHYLP
jgi:hypothetical protein